jgi:hypothetical protein
MARISSVIRIRKHEETTPRWELAVGCSLCKASLRVDREVVDWSEIGELQRLPDGHTCEIRFTPDPKAKALFCMHHGMTDTEYLEMVEGIRLRCSGICTACE